MASSCSSLPTIVPAAPSSPASSPLAPTPQASCSSLLPLPNSHPLPPIALPSPPPLPPTGLFLVAAPSACPRTSSTCVTSSSPTNLPWSSSTPSWLSPATTSICWPWPTWPNRPTVPSCSLAPSPSSPPTRCTTLACFPPFSLPFAVACCSCPTPTTNGRRCCS